MEKKKIIIWTGVVLALIISFMMGGSDDSDIAVVEKDSGVSVTSGKDVLDDKEIDFSAFVQSNKRSGGAGSGHVPYDFYQDTDIPVQMKEIIRAIEKQDYEKAFELIRQIERVADQETRVYLVYYKAQIFYMRKDIVMAKVYFEEFIKRFPEHDFAVNAGEALEFINAYY